MNKAGPIITGLKSVSLLILQAATASTSGPSKASSSLATSEPPAPLAVRTSFTLPFVHLDCHPCYISFLFHLRDLCSPPMTFVEGDGATAALPPAGKGSSDSGGNI